MAVKSSKNTMAASHFRFSLMRWVEYSGKKKNELAAKLGLSPSNFGDYLHGVKSPSLAVMEEIATAIGKDLADMLTEGRSILEGRPLPAAKGAPAPPPLTVRDLAVTKGLNPDQIQLMHDFHDLLLENGVETDMLVTLLEKWAAKKRASQNPEVQAKKTS